MISCKDGWVCIGVEFDCRSLGCCNAVVIYERVGTENRGTGASVESMDKL